VKTFVVCLVACLALTGSSAPHSNGYERCLRDLTAEYERWYSDPSKEYIPASCAGGRITSSEWDVAWETAGGGKVWVGK